MMQADNRYLNRINVKQFLRFAFHAIPELFQFQLLTKGILALSLFGLSRLANVLLKGSGFSAITSSDILKVLKTWQGWLLIIVLLFILFFYTAMEILAQIINSSNIMNGTKTNILRTYADGFLALKAFVSPGGIPLIIFVTFAVPLTGIGYTISLTRDFHLPNFMTSVIFSNPWLIAAYVAGFAAAVWFSLANAFTFPGVVLGGLSVKKAKSRSSKLVWTNKKDLIRIFVPIVAVGVGLSVLIEFVFDLLPSMASVFFGTSGRAARIFGLIFGFGGDILQLIVNMLLTSGMILLITVLYRLYTEERITLMEEQQEIIPFSKRTQILIAVAVCVVGAVVMEFFYSDLLMDSDVRVIAHRAGGDLAAENSLEGISLAAEAGAYGSEIDVQRTKDGYYVVNHDSNFSRLCGDSRKSSEMTLEEIRGLTITDRQYGTLFTAPVATLEEMLDEIAETGTVLFIELKGSTADTQMADDVVAMVKERDLIGNCVVISLKRDLIAYTENTYPEVNTGLLYYMGYGDAGGITADLLVMEEDTASDSTIEKAHRAGRTVVVWTVNQKDDLDRFLDSKVDAVITDHVNMAIDQRDVLNQRNDIERIQALLKRMMS